MVQGIELHWGLRLSVLFSLLNSSILYMVERDGGLSLVQKKRRGGWNVGMWGEECCNVWRNFRMSRGIGLLHFGTSLVNFVYKKGLSVGIQNESLLVVDRGSDSDWLSGSSGIGGSGAVVVIGKGIKLLQRLGRQKQWSWNDHYDWKPSSPAGRLEQGERETKSSKKCALFMHLALAAPA